MLENTKQYCCFAANILYVSVLLVAIDGGRPTVAQDGPVNADGSVKLPSDFLDNSIPPGDAEGGADASLRQLGEFAWREFIALSWPVKYPTVAEPQRGTPDNTKHFYDTVSNGPMPKALVWETYNHRVEMFPAQTGSNDDPKPFDTFPPVYKPPTSSSIAISPSDPEDPLRKNFHNLDEVNEIGRCTLYAHSKGVVSEDEFQVLYEAKVNRRFHEYIVANKLYDTAVRKNVIKGTPGLLTETEIGTFDLLRYGSGCGAVPPERTQRNPIGGPVTIPTFIVRFPCGKLGGREGAIEVKPAWRQLTDEERASGRFYMNTVQFYKDEESDGETVRAVKNEVYGLIALHIIQKTESFPSFSYATFEQVDNATSGLRYENIVPSPFEKPTIDGGEFPVERQHGIPTTISAVTVAVHKLIKAKNPSSVWQYYRLIGVQANATDPPGPDASQDEISTFNLANLVVETNAELQTFSGGLTGFRNQNNPNITNTFKQGRAFNAGGCLGCHGAQGQRAGYDFSVIAAKGGGQFFPEPIGMEESEKRLRSFELWTLGMNEKEKAILFEEYGFRKNSSDEEEKPKR